MIAFAALARMRGTKLDTNTAFTSIAILGLVTHPINLVLTAIPRVAAGLASLERIQNYLLKSDREDRRLDYADNSASLNPAAYTTFPAITLENVTLQPFGMSEPVIKDVNINIPAASLTMLVGPIGSGKTTLAKAVLGDIIPKRGQVSVLSKLIGYCSQAPWLPNESIRCVISGSYSPSATTEHWYKTVVSACCLDEDLLALPERDETIVGSRGIALSGGQRQRISLARAVFARPQIVVLDDILSALDTATEKRVVRNLFHPRGLLKRLGTTILLITHSTQHLSLADHIIVLGSNSRVVDQGSWKELGSQFASIQKVIASDDGPENDMQQATYSPLQPPPNNSTELQDDLKRQTGDLNVYGR